MPEIDKAVADYNLDRILRPGPEPDHLRPGSRGLPDLQEEPAPIRDLYGRNTFGQSCLLARRLVEAGTRVVEVIWPKVANSDNHSWDHHVGLTTRMQDQSGPDARRGPVRPDRPTWTSAACSTRRWSWPSASSAAARRRASAPRATATAPTAAITGRTATPPSWPAPASSRGYVHGKSDKTGSAPLEDPVHPGELLATIYHAFGIDPATIVYNHLNQPRELVKAEAVTRFFA